MSVVAFYVHDAWAHEYGRLQTAFPARPWERVPGAGFRPPNVLSLSCSATARVPKPRGAPVAMTRAANSGAPKDAGGVPPSEL